MPRILSQSPQAIAKREWWKRNRARALRTQRAYYRRNKTHIDKIKAAWNARNREAVNKGSVETYYRYRERILARHKRYRATERFRLVRLEARKRQQKDPQASAYRKCIAAVGAIIAGRTTGYHGYSKYLRLLGCSREAFLAHIESKFVRGMSWRTRGHGPGKWHVDHIKNASEFDLTKPKQLAQFFHFSHTQPLWANLNSVKRGGQFV